MKVPLVVLQFCALCSRISKQRDIDSALWFREIYGGPHAFGLEPPGSHSKSEERS